MGIKKTTYKTYFEESLNNPKSPLYLTQEQVFYLTFQKKFALSLSLNIFNVLFYIYFLLLYFCI